MGADETAPKAFSLKRWSQRKLEAARAAAEPAPAIAAAAPPPADVAAPAAVDVPPPAPAASAATDTPALPPVESLTIDADFTAFLQPKVEEALKRQALKQLFRDPRFNVMDGLDVYIDDYSKPDPIPPDILKQLVQGRYVFDPPATRVNARGEVEDVPSDDAPAVTASDSTEARAEGASDSTEAPAEAVAGAPGVAPDALSHATPDGTASPASDAGAAVAVAATPAEPVPPLTSERTEPRPR